MVQPNTHIEPNGDIPTRVHKSYLDKMGSNPMKASFDNCFIKTRLGVDPITGKPITVFDEQINREQQILESLGELVRLFRYDITPDKNINGGSRCILCFDQRRGQARANCPLCNGSGIVTNDPNITRVNGFEWIKNPDREDGLFFIHQSVVPQKMESKDIGFVATHSPRFWTTPRRNASGNIVNFLNNRDVVIRYIFDNDTKRPIRELERLVIMESNYSLAPNNQLLHMEFSTEKLNPGVDSKQYALPNGL